jgi:hypothetical protein
MVDRLTGFMAAFEQRNQTREHRDQEGSSDE